MTARRLKYQERERFLLPAGVNKNSSYHNTFYGYQTIFWLIKLISVNSFRYVPIYSSTQTIRNTSNTFFNRLQRIKNKIAEPFFLRLSK